MDFADDISLLAELLSLLIPVLGAFTEEAAAIGLEVNWDKTKVQALGTHQLDTETLDVYGQQVAVVDEFVYLGALTHSSVLSCYDIHCRSGSLAVRCKNLTIASGNHGFPWVLS